MRKTYCIMLAVFLSCIPVLAGEKPPIHLTGIPSVDFFAGNALPASERLYRSDSTMPILQEENMEGKKNPWVACALSLAIPGAGEVYTHSYVKAGIFAATEIASIVLAVKFNSMGDDQTAWFETFADQHYNPAQYARWTMDNINLLTGGDIANASGYQVIKNTGSTAAPYDSLNWPELNRMESDVAGAGNNNGYTHDMPYHGQQQYYELIGKYDQFSTGWDDADLSPATVLPIGNRSAFQQRHYMDERARANHYYDIAGTYVGVIVVNHLLSALDAYWSATRYNSALHASMSMKWEHTPDGLQPVPVATLSMSF